MTGAFQNPMVEEPPRVIPPPNPVEPDPDLIARLIDERDRRNVGSQRLRFEPGLERDQQRGATPSFRDILG